MKDSPILTLLLALVSCSQTACNMHREEAHHEAHKIVATNPQAEAINLTQR